jgi:photosystem II stability/assembly factor-like uncharacterized protein
MNGRKQTPKLILILLILTVVFAGENMRAGAQTPPELNLKAYLPMVVKPGVYYLPLVLNNYPEPPVQVGPYGGSVVALAVNPSNSSIVYAGSFGDGVFKSNDGGSSWVTHKAGLGNLYIISLAVDPSQPDTVYAGTQKGGIYKSTDGGVTWSAANSGIQNNAVVYSLAVNNGNHDILLAGTRGENDNSSPPWFGILYRSTNGGASWTPVLQNVGGSGAQDWVYSIAVNPTSPEEVFAASHEHGPYRSENYGASWSSVMNNLSDGSGRAIAVDPRSSNSDAVYYAVWHRTGVYKSTNAGASWASTSSGLGEAKVYPNGFVLAPTQPNTIYLADFTGLGVMKSTNAANSWSSVGLGGIYIYSVAVNPNDSDSVIAGTLDHGIYRSSNGGGSWGSSQVGLTNTQVSGMVSGSDGALYASTQGGGVYKSSDQGATWNEYNHGLNDMRVNGLVASPADANVLFALTNSGLYRADLKAGTWRSLTDGLPAQLGLSSASASTTPYGTDHPFTRSEPGYELLQDTPAAASAASLQSPVLAMTFAPSQPQQVYAGTAGAGLFASSDGGAHWASAGLAGATVWSLSVQPDQPQVLAAAIKASTSARLSSDGGGSWSDTGQPDASVSTIYTVLLPPAQTGLLLAGTNNGVWSFSNQKWAPAGLNGTPVVLLAADPDLPGRLYAGTTHGAFFSDDSGASWKTVSPGLDEVTVQSFHFDAADSHTLVVGTTTQGALRVQKP